ncbi:MAG TPA: hypothetical protein VFJ16_26580 [Longimicrobium sp.]|nr:hypothetical protein [Longimicrobium sp.]
MPELRMNLEALAVETFETLAVVACSSVLCTYPYPEIDACPSAPATC